MRKIQNIGKTVRWVGRKDVGMFCEGREDTWKEGNSDLLSHKYQLGCFWSRDPP